MYNEKMWWKQQNHNPDSPGDAEGSLAGLTALKMLFCPSSNWLEGSLSGQPILGLEDSQLGALIRGGQGTKYTILYQS